MSETVTQPEEHNPVRRWLLLAALPVILHVVTLPPDEPVYNGDANRHVMTSVFFRDFLVDLPLDHPKQYSDDYYKQYPALGLLIWPPLFHGTTGLLMTVFGTSVLVPRLFIFACFAFSVWCLYRLCRRRTSATQSDLVIVIFSLMPMIFEYSRFVMLEMPTLALCLLSVERFDIWLSEQKTRNVYVAAVAAALAALTRFDAVVLLPTFVLMTLFQGRIKQLVTRHIPIASVVALTILGPTYIVIWNELGDLHIRQAAESVSGTNADLIALGKTPFYPMIIPFQAGWTATAFFLAGVIAAVCKPHRATATVFFALLFATYITFTPLAEVRARHAIYWLPAIAYFASVGAIVLAAGIEKAAKLSNDQAQRAAFFVVICGTAWTTYSLHPHRVTGYSTTAAIVLENTRASDRILIDAWWDGNITYHLRHLDESRSRHIVRADHVMYDFINVPSVDFEQFVESDAEILKAIADTQATCIVFEDPQPFGHIAISERMHAVVKSMPMEFPLLKSVPVDVTFPGTRPFTLKVFSVDRVRLHAHLKSIDTLPNEADGPFTRNHENEAVVVENKSTAAAERQ